MTICAWKRGCIFGKAAEDGIVLLKPGEIVKEEWLNTAVIRPYVALDEFTVMPKALVIRTAHADLRGRVEARMRRSTIGRYFSSGEANRQDSLTASGYLTADLWRKGEGGRTCLRLRFGIGGKRLISKSPISVSGRPTCCLSLP